MNFLKSAYDFILSSKRRIAIISSSLTTAGGAMLAVGLLPIPATIAIVVGTLGTAIFGSLDAKQNFQSNN